MPGHPASNSTISSQNTDAKAINGKYDLVEIFTLIIHPLHALWANRAHQSLGDKRFHDRSEQERLHIHVEQTSDAADRVVRVQRAENKVTGHRCADRDVRRLDVTNLAHHDNVRVLPQNVTQAFGEGKIDLRFHVNLRDAGQTIFDLSFDGDGTALHRIDARKKAIKRC